MAYLGWNQSYKVSEIFQHFAILKSGYLFVVGILVMGIRMEYNKNLPLWEVYRTWDIIAFSHCFWELCPRRALLIWCLNSWEWSKRFRRCQRRSNNQNQYQRGASRCQIESSGIEKLDAQFNINISMIWIDSRLVHDWDSTILMWQGLYIRSIISINEEGTWCALSDNHDGLWGLSPFGRSSRYRESQQVDHRKSRRGIERYYRWMMVALAGFG